jgi:hypothetical protein
MYTRRIRASRQRRGVAILAFTVVLTVIAAVTAMFLSGTLMDHSRMNERRRELWRAFLHAEAGIAQVQHWALHPDDYTVDANVWAYAGGSTPAEKYPGIAAELANGGLTVSENDLDSMGITGFATETGWSLGRISQIQILPLDGTEPATAAGSFFKIVSLGTAANDTIQREVTGYATLTNVINIQLPAPLISLTTAGTGGNPKVHWGEAWAKNVFHFGLSPNNLSHALSDPFVVYRSEGDMTWASSWKEGTTSHNKDIYSGYMSYSTSPDGRRAGLFPDGNGTWKDKFYTHVPPDTLAWPELASEYQTFKDMALANGRYYTTNASNQLLKDGTVVDFYTEFTVVDRANAPMDLAFIDTTDGNPPNVAGSNLATLSVSGNNGGLKGFLYINANFDASGVGSPPGLTTTNPITNTSASLEKIFLDGVIYTAGTIEMSGNAGVYGSIVTERGFVGQGTPDIYYNTDLADGLDLGGGNLGSPFIIQLHTNNAP